MINQIMYNQGGNIPLVRHQKPNKTSYSESRETNPCSLVFRVIDCIGHSMNNRLQEVYREKLIEKYGVRLQYTHSSGAHSYSYTYELKDK